MAEYLLPDVGEGLVEAEIVTWRVAEGDTVAINDILVDIETAKSIVELPSPFAGVVEELLVAEGATVEVGAPIIRIGEVGAEERSPAEDRDSAGSPAEDRPIDTNVPPAAGENTTLVGYGPREVVARRKPRKGGATPRTDAGAAALMQVQGAFAPGGAQSDAVSPGDETTVPVVSAGAVFEALSGSSQSADSGAGSAEGPAGRRTPARVRALAKPPVRKLARALEVDLTSLTGSGPEGSITRDDVLAAAPGTSYDSVVGGATPYDVPARTPTTSYDPVARAATPYDARGEWREPIKGVRKAMAQAMVASAFTAPHVTEWVTVDVTATLDLLERFRQRPEFADVKVSPLLILARACVLAIRRTPQINARWDEQAQEVVFRSALNLGVAAATPRGLIVPNIAHADQLALPDLARALGALTATAREGRTQPAQMSGGTFTITNVGVFGIDAGTPIINPGESAILCFGAIRREPWVVGTGEEERVEIRDVCTLALSFDHRHIDGESGSRFLADVAGVMADPGSALLF